MSSAASSIVNRGSGGAATEGAGLSVQSIVDGWKELMRLAEKHNSVKLGLCLAGLWVLNWVY